MCWYFAGCFLCLMLPYLKLIWQTILKISRKSRFNDNLRYNFIVQYVYRISSDKSRASNKPRPLISATPLGIQIKISTCLKIRRLLE